MLAGDVIERLLDFAGADDGGDAALRKARRALQDAIREFPGLHRWAYQYTHGRLQLKGSYSTGTVAYNSSTRALTLSGGTWPAWAGSADVRIGDVVSEVATRDSNTVLTLSSTVCPGADITAGAAYVVYQDSYILPDDYLAQDSAVAESSFGNLEYVHPSSHLWATRAAEQSGTPVYWTVVNDRYTAGRFALRVFPFPDEDQTLDFIYQRRMRRVIFDGAAPESSGGTVSITNGSAVIAGSGTDFDDDMVGATLRVSGTSSELPTGVEGGNRAAFESKILSVSSATSLTVADNAAETLTGVAYRISDPIDLEEGTMATALCWQAIKHLANELRMKDREVINSTAVERLVAAKEHDARNFSMQRIGSSRRRVDRRYMPTGDDEV